MEEYPTACQPQLDATSLNPEHFQIKDQATGKVLEINEDGGVAFAESNGLSKQFWFWYRDYKSEAKDGALHNKQYNRILAVDGMETDEYKEVKTGNSNWLKYASNQMWTRSNGKIFSTKEGYTVLAVRDNKLVVLKEGTDTTIAYTTGSETPEQTFISTIKGDQCEATPPPPGGKFSLRNNKIKFDSNKINICLFRSIYNNQQRQWKNVGSGGWMEKSEVH